MTSAMIVCIGILGEACIGSIAIGLVIYYGYYGLSVSFIISLCLPWLDSLLTLPWLDSLFLEFYKSESLFL